ncbi:MAG: zinc ribbon domain-containing protein [Promethearchaeota archaeon]|jgi:hypothetical protein
MKKYTWLFPFLSGILASLALLAPVAFTSSYFSIWMWGLIDDRIIDNSLNFMSDRLFFFTGIGASIAILIFSVLLIVTGQLYHRGSYAYKNFGKIWIICGALILTGTIVSTTSLDYYTYEGFFPYGVWAFINPGFGVVGPILASITAIGSGIFVSATEKGKRARLNVIPISTIAPKSLCPHCGKEISLNASFCSKCGKIIDS